MSINRVTSRFCKCGDLHHLSRRFHNLDADAKRYAAELIISGIDPAKAIRKAKGAK